MAIKTVGVIMNGVTGRMGMTQHLLRSIMAIRSEGGFLLPSGDRIMPEPFLVGRNEAKLASLARDAGGLRWTTDVDAALADPAPIFFDAANTQARHGLLSRAIAAGKHIYCEKPAAATHCEVLDLLDKAQAAGVKHGVVQDKLWLPGLVKLRRLIENGFFGRILSVRIEFGYWVFAGPSPAAQRPSWNYRAEEGGGIILDMMPHWHYVIENLFGPVERLFCVAPTHLQDRIDSVTGPYKATADDAAYALIQLANGVVISANSSWCTRVRRDDLVTFHVDGVSGSAVAGLTDVHIQHAAATPKPVWNPDARQSHDFFSDWNAVPETEPYENAFRAQWQAFLLHVTQDDPFPWDLRSAAQGVLMAEKAMESARTGSWAFMDMNGKQKGIGG